MRKAVECTWVGLIGLVMVSGGCEVTSDPGDPDCRPASLDIVAPLDGSEIRPAHDVDDASGIQADVRVETNLAPGSSLLLSVIQNDTTTETVGTVGPFGEAVFAAVTLPSGQITLEVRDEGCSGAVAEAGAFVFGDARCSLRLTTEDQINVYYAPFRVANASNDAEPEVPGFQTNAVITTDPGYAAELVVTGGATSEETEIGLPAGESGEFSVPLTLGEGVQTVEVRCLAPDGAVTEASDRVVFLVDTVAPTCSIEEPAADVSLTQADDADPARDGTQVPLRARFEGDDIAGKTVRFVMQSAGYTLVAPRAEIDADGQGSAIGVFWVPGPATLSASASDYAGNPCLAERTVDYE